MLKSVHHIGAVVKDMDKCLDFYINKLGAKLVWDHKAGPQEGNQTDIIFCEESTGVYVAGINIYGTLVEFFQFISSDSESSDYSSIKSLGWKHIALEVADIDQEYERLAKEGVEFLFPVQTLEHGDRMVYFKDPNGLILELIQPVG
ncbi:MAG: VOC family protein [Halanaerobiales bacterium]